VSSRERLGWGPFFEEQLRSTGAIIARVVEEQRGAYRVDGDVEGLATLSGRYRYGAASRIDLPAVGDWVELSDATIVRRLDRRSAIVRAAAGRATEPQVIAANVDTILIVTALTRDLNPRRLERYLTMVWDSGAAPVIVLNKADLCDDPEREAETLRGRLPFVDVVITAAVAGAAARDPAEALAPFLRPAATLALVGSSGVGKSTIINVLAEGDRQRTSGMDADGKGRHTTTSRQLIALAGGALLIDTPGMRELQLWADNDEVEGAFADIGALGEGCRFADCRHDGEPGCAVAEAIARGELDQDRLENFRRLLREAAFEARKRSKAAEADARRKLRQQMRALNALYRDRDRS